ncbi:hypothetical protein Smic_36830 [Streptomyces microflavus]|uniref:Uncharacterized protein n=1 Tax=Streptomyces microflavus TaxID=1919 RepID=A0A7J0CTN4_STRMI|nr:hypothetical protein Smic_36830 [Streptomyces microflavus]
MTDPLRGRDGWWEADAAAAGRIEPAVAAAAAAAAAVATNVRRGRPELLPDVIERSPGAWGASRPERQDTPVRRNGRGAGGGSGLMVHAVRDTGPGPTG